MPVPGWPVFDPDVVDEEGMEIIIAVRQAPGGEVAGGHVEVFEEVVKGLDWGGASE